MFINHLASASRAFLMLIVGTGMLLTANPQSAQQSSTYAEAKLIATLGGHTNSIMDFAFSPDGETVATGSEEGTVRLWNTTTGELRATFNCGYKYRWMMKIVWSPDGSALVIDGRGGDVRPQIWDAATGKLRAELTTRDTSSITWSPDSRRLLTTAVDSRIVKLWDAETGSQLATLQQDVPCPKQSFWKSVIREQPCNLYTYVTADFGAGGHSVITASSEEPAKLWDAATGKLKMIMPLRGEEFFEKTYQSDLVMSPDRRLVASYIHNEVALLDTSTGEVKRALGQIGLPMAFSPDSKMLLTTVRKPTYSTLGNWDEFKLYDVATGQLQVTFERVPLITFRRYLNWSLDGHTILVGSGSAELLDARTGKIKGSLRFGGCTPDQLFGDDGCQPFILSADGRIAVKVKNPLRLWDTDNGTLLKILDTARSPALFSPTNPGLLITRGKDKRTALLWEIRL
jgi:WD40 repeat protein